MRKLLSLALLIFPNFFLYAQSYDFIGSVIVKEPQDYLFSYRIFFDLTDSNQVTGYSISDVNGPDETKAFFKGEIKGRGKKRNLLFSEKEIIYCKSENPSNQFCMLSIDADILELKENTLIKGSIIGILDADSSNCAEGIIYMLGTKSAYELLTKMNELKPKMDEEVTSALSELSLDEVNSIKANEEKTIIGNSDTRNFSIWDHQDEDGDVVNLKINNKLYLKEHVLTGEKRSFNLPLTKETDYTIVLSAENMGKVPPNTAKVVVSDGEKSYLFLTDLRNGESCTFKVLRK